MAANASGNPQQANLQQQHEANLVQPMFLPPPYTNNWTPGQGGIQQGTATTTTASGVQAPNPYGLTTEQIYWALAGTPDSIRRLGESLGGYGEGVDPAKKQLFHTVVNYYASGGGAFDTGYTPEDAAKAQANYMASSGTPYQSQTWLAGMPVYGSMADAAAGGVVGPGATAAGNGTNIAGYATGQGTNLSSLSSTAPPPPTNGTPSTGGGSSTPGNNTPAPGTTGGSDDLGDKGQSEFPIASAATYARPTYAPYQAPERPAEINTPFDLFNDEGYKFRLKEGSNAIQNQAAAKGGLMSGNTLKSLANYASGLASQEYGEAFGRYDTSRKFGEGQFQTDRNFGRNSYDTDRNFDFGTIRDERDYNNSNRMWDTSFNNANRIDARNFDYGVYTGDRDFNEGVRRYDLGFNYNAANADRTFDAGLLTSLAGMGLSGTNASGNLAATLAAILGQNTMTGAGAGAAGTVGQANTANGFISQLLAYLQANNMLGQLTGGAKP